MTKSYWLAFLLLIGFIGRAESALTLEFWQGVQDLTPVSLYSGSFPTRQGLTYWDFTGQSKLNSLALASSQQYVLKLVLRDHDPVGNGSGFTFSGTAAFGNHFGFHTFAMRFDYVPGVLSAAQPSSSPYDLTMGGVSGTPTYENFPYAVANSGPTYITAGGLYQLRINKNGEVPFQQPNGDVLYPLANLVLTAGAPGSGTLKLSKPTSPPPTFASLDDNLNIVNYDAAVC